MSAAAWQRRAAGHRAGGRPLAAERAYRSALTAFEEVGDERGAAAVRADYATLLLELGRDREAAELGMLSAGPGEAQAAGGDGDGRWTDTA